MYSVSLYLLGSSLPLRAIFSVLDLMKVDMANFAVSSIRPHLMQQSVEYERSKFQEFLEKQPSRQTLYNHTINYELFMLKQYILDWHV